MPKYLVAGSYTAEGAKGLLAEGGTARRAATEKLLASAGATLEAYYFALGSDDFYIIADVPGGNTAVAAAALTASASGAVRTRTIVLLTPEEVDAASKVSLTYRAPGA
jgi:uncharacterized protein with GYD domain